MKKKLAIAFVSIGLCMSISLVYGEMSLIMNGSFEQDGDVIPNLIDKQPLYWCDVNIPDGKFKCKVQDTWYTHKGSGPGVALEIRSEVTSLNKGDIAEISQQVYLEQDIESISFDLLLTSLGGEPWSHDERSAVILIDGQPVWDSNVLTIDVGGEFLGTVEVGSDGFVQFLDNDWHKLTVAMKSNINDSFPYDWYICRWDFIKFDKYCGGLGYLSGDFSQDCYIDFPDFALFAQYWLRQGPPEKYDLYEDGEVNNLDLMLLAEDWLFNSDWTKWGQEGTEQMELLDLDLDLSGQIDPCDLQIFWENWLQDPPPCSLIDQYPDGDEIINFKDFAVFAGQWGYKDWIYYMD